MTQPRFVLALTINMLSASIATSVFALTSPIPKGSLNITLSTFATIPGADGTPQDLAPIGDGTGRMFVATRNGKIDIVGPNGTAATFLDMRTVAGGAGLSIQVGTEGGLLAFAFSPNYYAPAGTPGSGKFYTFQTESFNLSSPAADFSHPEIFPTTTRNPNNQITIREWSVSGDPNIAQTTSRVLLRINHPADNHQGGGLKFGPDGNLYISLGDGGLANDGGGGASPLDGHTDSVGNGQDKSVVFGKILRIDPNGTGSANGQYGIPASNPFSNGVGGLQEIYAYGFRNPYRFSFDALNGRLLVGDVGEGAREEIDSVTVGANYGWPFREGTRDNSLTNGSGRAIPDGFSSIAPLAEYTHGDGLAVLGGFVYRGTDFPSLNGKYIFGDLGSSIGRLFYMDAAGGMINEFNYLGAGPSARLLGFGEGDGGQVYALFANGTIVSVVPEPSELVLLATILPAWFFRRRWTTIGRRA